jgi:aminopeptidase YwaD
MTITYAKAEELIGLSGTKCTLTIKQKTGKGAGTNIVVSVGNKKIDETVTYLVGHYDSVAWSHGSVDNAGGTVCLLKAAEYFAKNQPERELKIIFFSGEELGLLGSSAYVKKHKKEVKNRAALVVNVDVSGEIIGDDVFTVTGTKQLLGYAAGIAREEGLMFKERLSIYSSDSIPFAVKEVPSVNIYRSSGKAAFYIHTKDDVGKNVSPEGLQNSYQAAQALLNRVLGSKIYPVRREIDDSLRENLEKYLWNLYLEKPSLEWKPKYKR